MHCYDEGSLRAYLDDALPIAERALLAAHIARCPACRACLNEQQALTAQVGALLVPASVPAPHDALMRLRAGAMLSRVSPLAASSLMTQATESTIPEAQLRRKPMSTLNRLWSNPRRPLFASLALIVVLLSLLALPPVRAAADQLLSVFRVQKVLFVPTNAERIRQLQNLNFDQKTLFVASPKVVNKPAAPRTVDSSSEVAGVIGLSFRQPASFPSTPTSTKFTIHDRTVVQFQVDVQSARQLLTLMDVNDVTLPDALGAKPITADVPTSVEAHYQGADYQFTLYQGHSPTVTLPNGVELSQLGKAALRLLGMDSQQAEALSKSVDWSSTLIFPFPADLSNMQIQQVSVGSAQGMLVGDGHGRQAHWQLYWQQGDRFYMLQGQGNLAGQDMIAAAESVR
jgi:Putative zinc-finger